MTERRRPLENDDGQVALFGGEAFAPAAPAPSWKRPAQQEATAAAGAPAATTDAPPAEARFEARAEADGAPSGLDAEAKGPPAAGAARAHFEADAAASRPTPAAGAAGTHVDADAAASRPTPAAGAAGTHVDADAAASRVDVAVPARPVEPGATPSPFADEIAELERATVVRAPRSPRAPLAGPTLDDVMSRVWEGLATGLPAACPMCHGEVVAAISGPPRGRCTSCATTIE